MKKSRRIMLATGLCVLAVSSQLPVVGHAFAGVGHPAGTLNHGTMIQIKSWNPLLQSGQTYTSIVYEGLTKVAPDGFTVLPSLAAEWNLTPDALQLTLRSGVVFHDGTPFDAQAVKKNIEWIKNSGTQWAASFSTISDISIEDATHLTLHLSKPTPTLPQRLATRGAYMVAPAAIDDNKWQEPVGTGPWVYDAAGSQRGSKEMFRYFDKYWAPENVGVDTIVMNVLQDPAIALNALLTGFVASSELEYSQVPAAESAGYKIVATPTLVGRILFLDRKQTFADENVRKAVCHAIDIDAVVQAGFNGYATPISQRFQPGQPGYNPDVVDYKHDLQAAKADMAAAGNPKISFVLPMYSGNQIARTLIAQQLRDVGMDVTTQLMDSGQYFTYFQSDRYPMQVDSSATEDIGPLDYYQFRFSASGKGNPFHVAVPELDEIAARALDEPDGKKQNAIWQEMTRYLHDHALDCGFYVRQTVWAYDSKALAGLPTTVMRPSALRYDEVRLVGK